MHTRYPSNSPRKSSLRHPPASSNPTLAHSTPLSTLDQGVAVPSGAHSLAHELAFALMPDPASGASRLLAEEFGIEYDEGAEGIDDDPLAGHANGNANLDDAHDAVLDGGASLADELELGESTPVGSASLAAELGSVVDDALHAQDDEDTRDHSDDEDEDAIRRVALAQDAMEVLAQNLASTDRFLAHLRTIDTTFTLENLTTEMISGLNDAVRDREGQVRELVSHDRDLRRITTEVGGVDVLGDLDPLEVALSDDESGQQPKESFKLESVAEEEEIAEGDSLYGSSLPSSPQKPFFAPACTSASLSSTSLSSSKPLNKTSQQPQHESSISTLTVALPSMTHMRSHTASFLASLTIISEQSQVDSAATADAGRKIRSVKNQLAKWKVETEGAERSRSKIEKWEAESVGRRDGRVVVDEHLRAFEKAIVEAGMKTRAIMAR